MFDKRSKHSIKTKCAMPLDQFRLCTFDCEAVTFNSVTKEGGGSDNIDLIGFYDGEEYRHFKKGIDFLEFIWDNMDKYNKCYIYAHNFSGYDIYAFLDDLTSKFMNNYSVVDINGRFVEFSLFKIVKGKRYIVSFRDSYKILPDKLANLGKAFGFPKTEQPPFDHDKYALPIVGGEKYYNEMYANVMEYNKNDCVILYKILKEFFSHVPGRFKYIPLTIPAIAFKVWKKMYNVRKCSELSNSYLYDAFIRESYSGGRTEVFKMFTKNDEYCYIDVNCYSEDTECWTEYGWKRYSELKIGMKVMTYNIKKKKMEMKSIQKIIVNHHKGDMHHYTGKNVDCLVTPNHNMIIKQHITLDEEEWVSSQCPSNCLFPNREDNSWSPCDKSIVEYEGIVWCITVDNHNFLTRRNNRKAWQKNSLYPYIMETHDFPVGKCVKIETHTENENYFKKGIPGFYKVEWEAPNNLHIPILWEKRDGKLLFPLNKKKKYKGKGTYALPELQLAQDRGYKFKFDEALIFPSTTNMFKEYVNEYKKMKFEGGAKKVIAKLFSNSLYGKFGQRTTIVNCAKLEPLEVNLLLQAGVKVEEVDTEMGLFNVEVQRFPEDIMVAWSAYITALARVYMWKGMERCNFNVAYTDSVTGDSLIYTKNGYNKIEDMFDDNKSIDVNGKEYCEINNEILSYNLNENKTEFVYPKYLMRHKVNKKGYVISLSNEEKITVTENHSVFTDVDKQLQVLKGDEIKKITNLVTLKNKIKFNTQEVFLDWLKGLYYANGSYNKHYSRISHKNYNYVKSKCLKEGIISYPSSKITDFYLKIQLGKKPKSINMELSKEEMNTYINDCNKRQSFIKGYWYGDGTITTTKYNSYIVFSSSSLKMLEQLQYLLFLDGFESTIVRDNGINGYGSLNASYNLKVLNSDEFVNVLGNEIYNKGTNYNIKILSKNNSKYTRLDKEYRKRTVTSVEEIIINDYVYDFETPSHTFCVKNILVHNTDSFVVKKKYAEQLWIDPKLYGAFKREYEVHKAMFISPKFYLLSVFDNEKKVDKVVLKIKGVHEQITKQIAERGYEFAENFILDHAKNEKKINVSSIVQFKMSRKLKDKPRSGSSRKMVKTLSLNYDKREVCPDGVETTPW